MYKLKQELPKEFKIKVNENQSEVLQKHLFSIGKIWAATGKEVQNFGDHYLYCHSYDLIGQGVDKKKFKSMFTDYPRIKFKDYFVKAEDVLSSQIEHIEQKLKEKSFPEKWCIEVTEENCNELNVWMHRNWKNYPIYKDTWEVTFDNDNDTFYSNSKNGWDGGYKGVFYELITTEQFREKFGIVKINETEIKAMESNIDFWHEKAQYYKEKSDRLRKEKYKFMKENDKLLHQVLMLTEKLETIKKVLQ